MNQMFMYGWHCLVLVEFMVMWKWLTTLQKVFELDHGNSAHHVLLLDICVNISKLDINEVCSTIKIKKGCE
jgi:hypothetical protein